MNNSAAHHALKKLILLDLGSELDVRGFDNPRGFDDRAKATYGLAPGATDLLFIVAPRGRWLALEVKTGAGRSTLAQTRFAEMVNRFGGIARVVRSRADARVALNEARR